MINQHKGVSGFGKYSCFETISFEYPFSLVKIEYGLANEDNKIKYARVGYNSHGRIVVKTKTPFPEWVKDHIMIHYLSMERENFVLKWSEIN